ncbi:TPA: aldose 1-epimerase [Burkholderia cenocepacia]|uniref:Aldose 1-epimerase n=1 Tax=Burkholderia latens TaxID=488446 RepID=A0A6H9SXR2_9BURK|nr:MULTISPECIES: aldose 1-epimerase [Burkholderia]KAB0644686.1 aldose 1-epimerase [Burkholderia latens]MBJ9922841.1 aldose 1-epimerase [Burkholderia cenocepacia]UJH78824.1 aldose 1-epimerase [Burkholderia cenocepacia]VWB22801.1 aldose 1-epimerase [Burkholderia latens]HDR9879851.1 aldose 1-epimerase [Burkholderia cenocepacia]
MTSPSCLTIVNDRLRADIAPHLGARVTRLVAVDSNTDLVVPLDAWNAPPHGWPKAGAYPLIPYSNRIAGAQLAFGDEVHALPPHPLDLPNTLHGIAHALPWRLVVRAADTVELALHYEGEHWPWPFDAQLGFRLERRTLHVRMSVRNAGERPMPAGLGWHPFLAAEAGAVIRFDAWRRWMLDSRFMPTGTSIITPPSITLDAQDWLDGDCVVYASDWRGEAVVERSRGRVRLRAGEPLTHVVAYVPRGAPYLCVEPVSHVANGFNLAAAGVRDTGTRVLVPGATLEAHASLEWEPAAEPTSFQMLELADSAPNSNR